MRTVWSLLVCAALFVVPNAHAQPKVEEQVIGPANTGGAFVLAPRGGRAAYIGLKGTRLVVTVDGVEGPGLDELYGVAGQSFAAPDRVAVWPGGPTPDALSPVIFSPDGAHHAYAGRQQAEYVVIHDGKEVARGPREALALNYGPLTLSPRGRLVHFMEIARSGTGAKWRLNVSGKPGPWSSNNHGMTPVFSADEARYAHNAASEKDPGKQILVVDGKAANYLGLKPVFTADGASLLSISPVTAATPKPSVLVDGKPVLTALSVDRIVAAPVGRRWGAIARTRMVGHLQVPAFFLDGKEVPGTEGASNAWFSPDGQHYAVVCRNEAARSAFMVVDGKKQKEYQGVSADEKSFWWTPDGSRFIYSVVAGGRPFLVVNGEESPITMLIGQRKIVLAGSGNRYGYGTRDGANRNHSLVVDGKNVLPPGTRPMDDTLAFSPDGSRYGFFAGPALRNEVTTLVLDGAVQEGVAPASFHTWVSQVGGGRAANGSDEPPVPSSLAFSRDGKRVAYMGRPAGGPSIGMFVDGKLVVPQARAVYFPTFTPDGRHLFWVADELKGPGQGALTAVYVDGVAAVRADGYFFRAMPGSFTMDENGAVTFFAADGAVVKRYRITASPDMDVDRMIAAAAATRARAVDSEKATKKRAEEEATAAKAKAAGDAAAARAAQEKRAADALKARQEALEARAKARKLQLLNVQRARRGLPPLTRLPEP